METKLNRKSTLNQIDSFNGRTYAILFRTQSLSEHFTKILSRMELNDLRADDSTETNAEDEKRANTVKATFGPFLEHMKYIILQ